MNPFHWLRRKVAESVVLGVSDGLAAVTPAEEDPPADLDELRALAQASIATKSLPAAQVSEESPKKRR